MNKTQVREFVQKCYRKAIKAVEDQQDKEYNKAIEKYLNQKGNEAIKQSIENFKIAYDSIKNIENQLSASIKSDCYLKINNCSDGDLIAYLFKGYYTKVKDDKLAAKKKECESKIDEVKKAYTAIEYMIQNARDGKQAKLRLEELGFDTSYLDKFNKSQMKQIDKKALFPCKENGVDLK